MKEIIEQNKFFEKYGPWALVTGASSGIGAEFCRQLCDRGINIIMVARRKNKMEELAASLVEKYTVEVKVIESDLSKVDFFGEIDSEISSIDIGLLINNAGFGVKGAFLTNSLERELELLNVNCRAPLELTYILGKKMVARKKGGIIFLSSVLGYTASPYFANYAASKAFNLFMGGALWSELKASGIDVSVLSPGSTKTEFDKVSEHEGFATMEAETVVKVGLRNIGQPYIVPGLRNKLAVLLLKLFPDKITTRLMGNIMRKMSHPQKKYNRKDKNISPV